MKKVYVLITLVLCCLLLGNDMRAQTTLNTVTLGNASYNGSNGAGSNTWITFVLENTSGSPILLTDVGNFYSVGQNGVVELWYSSTSLSGNPTALTAPAWTMIATTNVTITTAGVNPVFTGLNFLIPNNTQYRFAVWSAAYTHYSGAAGPPAPSTFTSGGVTLKVGDVQIGGNNVGYGGSNNPRWFTGFVTFMPALPCVSPPTAGTSTANPTNACAGSNVQLSLTGNTIGLTQTYQWQSGPTASGPWTNMGSSVTSPTVTINPTGTAYYRCGVTCGASTMYSTPVQVTIPPLFPGGTYTINSASPTSGTNFNSFTDAVSAVSCGIAGPVVFNVVPGSGPYTEQVTIPDIATTSATNTITFNGHGETLTYASTNTNERAGIKLDGADHIIIDSLVVAPTGSYGFGIQLINDADSNTINACTINNVLTSTSSSFACIVISGSHTSATTNNSQCDGNTISNNTTVGGYYGITCLGTTGAGLVHDNKIINNDVKEFYYYGIYAYGNENMLVENNEVSRPTRTTVSTFYGIYLSSYNINSKVSKNYIHTPMGGNPTSTSANYGITVASSDATVGNENIISNNLIVFENGNGTQYGLYNSGSDYAQFYYNTVSLENTASTSGTTRGFYQTTAAAGIDFKNNIISITRGGSGTKHAIYINNASTTITPNGNVYYMNASGTTYMGYRTGPGNLATLAAWQTAISGDANSVAADPQFTSATNYLPTAAAIEDIGTPVSVTTDILGNPRSVTTPDPGAYEMVPPCAMPTGLASSGITFNAANISWNATPGVVGYEYALTPGATPPATGTATINTTYNATGLTPTTTYYFHVRSNCGSNVYSAWATISFTTNAIPPCIPVTAPNVTNITMTTADISWNAVSGASGYEYAVNTVATPPASGTPTAGTSYNATGLTSGTTYYVHVRTDCGSSTYSVWVTTSFTTAYPPCLAPGVTVTNITVNGADISWTSVGTSVGYEYAVTATATPPNSGSTTTNTTQTVNGLTDDELYYAHVRTDCGPGGKSPWVTVPFSTRAYCTAPTAIISNVTDSRADINWNAMSSAISYEYVVSTTITPPTSGVVTTGLNYNADQLDPGTQYYIHLRSDCGSNELSNWSTSGFVTRHPTSVISVNTVAGIDVYPNPVNDKLTVSIKGTITGNAAVVITDLSGKVIREISVNAHKAEIDMGNLSRGVYMLKYADDNASHVTRIVKQ